MSNCRFCGKEIPEERIHAPGVGSKTIYCSVKCVKTSWYIKHKKFKTSSYINDPNWYTTETGKGYLWEQFAAKMLGGKWMGFGYPFDVLRDKVRIDVKTCNLYKRRWHHEKLVNPNRQSGWFSFHKYYGNSTGKDIDFLFCIGLINNVPSKIWLIPYNAISYKAFTICNKPSKKYDQYIFPFSI